MVELSNRHLNPLPCDERRVRRDNMLLAIVRQLASRKNNVPEIH